MKFQLLHKPKVNPENLTKWFSICKLLFISLCYIIFFKSFYWSLMGTTGNSQGKSENMILTNMFIILENIWWTTRLKWLAERGFGVNIWLMVWETLYCVLQPIITTHLLSGKQHLEFSTNFILPFLQNLWTKGMRK